MEKFTIESIENGIVKCEKPDGNFTEIDIVLLPENAKSGDIIGFDSEKYVILTEETAEKKHSMLNLQARLFGKKKAEN